MNKNARPSAEEYDSLKNENQDPVKAASRHRVEEANRKRNEEQEEAALTVDVGKFQRSAWLVTAISLAIVAVSVHVFTRYGYSLRWTFISLIGVALFYLWRSSIIRESFLAEVRERKADAAKDPKPQHDGDPTILDSESAEWMNAVIAKLWPIINTDLALPLLDIVEDALKDKYPNLIDTVRIEELDLGVTPFRIVKMKYLDPEERISEKHDVEQDSSRFVNMEVEFEYRGENRKVASDNLHMLIYMGIGASKLATIEIPTFAELSHASGSMRIRMELISDPPFAETATVSFPQMPDFTLSARPLKTVNVMRFPLMTDYVKKAVGDVISRFIAPDAFSLNVARLIMGQDVDLTTQAQGLVVIVIHSASDISNTDSTSKSDPFIMVSWSKLGKILYTSRVIRNELNPQWEEPVFIPVPPDALRDGDCICIQVWDSDRFTADDSLGEAKVNINDMYDKAGVIQTFDEPLSGAVRKSNNKGKVRFSAGYFKKADVSSGSTKAPAGTLVSMRVGDAGAPLQADNAKEERARHYSSRIKDTVDAKIPPSPKQSSGILAIQLHQLDDLELNQKNHTPQFADSRLDSNAPSTYAQIFVNDDFIFTTRLKRFTSSPYINARTEVFCKDWTRTRIDIVILDYRERENDAVLGVVSLRLSDILANTSQVSSWRPLLGGIGTGRCRVSILFKPIQIYLPPTLRGWNIGTLLVDQIVAHNVPANFYGKIVVRSVGTKVKKSTLVQSLDNDGHTVTWSCQPPLRIPLLRRYQRALSFTLVEVSQHLSRTNSLGEGILWMSNVVDDTVSEPEIRLYNGPESKRRRANNDNSLAEGIAADTPQDSEKNRANIRKTRSAVMSSQGTPVHQEDPYLQVSLRFSRGLSALHTTLLGDVALPTLQDTLRMREHAIQAGERKEGSARFHHRDQTQKIARQRNLTQAQEAAFNGRHQGDGDEESSDAKHINLGSVRSAEGGGLAETPKSALNEADGQGDAGDQDELVDEEDWEEEDAAEDAHETDAKGAGFIARKRDDMHSDRLQERGVFQSKLGRSAKWIKDSSKRKSRTLREKLSHADGVPTAPETEHISHLT